MKNIYLCIVFILPVLAFAQSPCDQTQVTLSSQSEVDSFPTQFCSSVCSLTITGNDITNLDSLYVLGKVGRLVISFNPVLTDISGLSNITAVENSCSQGGIEISNNNLLDNLDGLSSLARVEGSFTINGNTMLNDITGLSTLTDIDELTISSNASLQNLNGLEGLQSIGGHLIIDSNPALTDLGGLSNVTTIAGGLLISYNDALADLDGLSGLTRVLYQLSINNNEDLASLQALSNIDHIGQFSASGESLVISFNETLTSLDGLQGLDSIPGTTTIEGNGSLVNLDGLSSVTTFDPPLGDSYNSGIRISGNNSLVDISGIAAIQTIGKGRSAYLEIISNASLTTIDSLDLTAITGSLGSRLMINGNTSLANVDGLSSLERVTSGLGALVQLSDNPVLENLNGLSNLVAVSSSRGGTLTITNNAELGSFCGLYELIHARGINCGFTGCYSTAGVTISGNENNPTPEEIEAAGPCDAVTSQPTNLVFSQVSSGGMRVRFNRGDYANGYLVLMRSYGAPAPDDVPADGQTYNVGQVIGSSSIVVHNGADTTFVVSGLEPSTPYYFDVFSYSGNDYVTVSPLEGHQSTTADTMMANTLAFTEVTDESITLLIDNPDEGNYITLMQAFGSPSPVDVPVDGTEYHVGNTIGSSTIVVHIGSEAEFTVTGLMANVKYYFDVYKYDPATFTYEDNPAKGNQVTSDSGENLRAYPNPFDVATTIPFVVSKSQSNVQVAIFDSMGREVNVLIAGSFDKGRHETNWDGLDRNGNRVTAGVYIYNVRSDGGTTTGRVSVR